jgi:phospholipid transport system substrate-binding protein
MPLLHRRSLLLASCSAALIGPAWAADPAVLAPAKDLIATLLAIMKQGKAVPFANRVRTLAVAIDRDFDLETILRDSVGTSWNTIPGPDQVALRGAFRDFTVASYVNNFDSLGGQRFEVTPEPRALPNGDQVAETRIVVTPTEAHALDCVMRLGGGTWRVVDVLAEGSVSRVAVQRSDFRRLLTQGGAAALIASLRTKTTELSAG